jgi:hypothetical protein
MMRSPRKTAVVSLVVLAVLAASSGCGMSADDWKPSELFSLDNAWPFDDDEPEKGTPVRVAGSWTDTVLTKPGQKPQRGFGGRLIFYGKKEDKPILVDGQLVVYAFDESNRDPTDNKPTRRYVFPPDQIPLHMSKSDVGATYSFWLPWDEAGGRRTEVSLICRFEPKGGPVITSEQTRHLLPGALAPDSATVTKQPLQLPEGVASRPALPTLEDLHARRSMNNTQLASYESGGDSQAGMPANSTGAIGTPPPRQMTVTSIALPDSFRMPDAAANARLAAQSTSPTSPPMQPAQQTVPVQQQQPPQAFAPTFQSQQTPTASGAYAAPQVPAGLQRYGANAFAAPQYLPGATPPTLYSPPTNGFGAAVPAPPRFVGQRFMTQGATIATAGAPVGGTVPAYPQQPAPRNFSQPAGQPLPAPSGMTTTVSYPPPGPPPLRPGG